jgi:hypothetical protein
MIAAAGNGTDIEDDLAYGDAAAPGNAAADEADVDIAADEIAAELGDVVQQRRELYASQPMLEALLALLQQLGSLAESRAAALQQLQQLPEMLLLHVLAASSSNHQQRVVEAVLPALIMFRDCVLPLMQPVLDHHIQHHLAQQEEVAGNDLNNAEQQPDHQQQEKEERQQQVKGLCLLACIASCLQDGEPGRPRPDAHIAGWGLLALATRSLQVLEQHLQQQTQQLLQLQLQEQQQQDVQRGRQHALISTPASCRFLEHICTRLTRSPTPDAAAGFVGATVHALATSACAMLHDADHVPGALEQQQEGDQQQQQMLQDAAATRRMHMSTLRAAGKVTALVQIWRRLAQH